MRVAKELKLNKFSVCSVPKNRDLFQRVGPRVVPEDQFGQVARFPGNTLDNLAAVEEIFLKDNQMPLDTV